MLNRDFVQADVLDRGPNNRQATGLRRENIDLIGALAHITEETFNSIGRLNVSAHGLRKGIKGQQVLFILNQASYPFWIALAILGFEGCKLYQCLLLCRLVPDANQFGLDFLTFSSRDGTHDIALLVDEAVLPRRC